MGRSRGKWAIHPNLRPSNRVRRSKSDCGVRSAAAVLSFLSAFGGPPRVDGGTGGDDSNASTSRSPQPTQKPHAPTSDTPSPPLQPSTTSGTSTPTRWSRNSRPPSMAFTYSPSLMDIAEDTPPELQPIFGFLNSHANKLYHEGYFLKLNDLDTCRLPARPPMRRISQSHSQ